MYEHDMPHRSFLNILQLSDVMMELSLGEK